MSHLSRNILLLLVVAVGGCKGLVNPPPPPKAAASMVLTAHQVQTLEIQGDWNISDVAHKLGTLPMALKRLNPQAPDRLLHGATIKVVAPKARLTAFQSMMKARRDKQLALRARVAKQRQARERRRAGRLKPSAKRRARRASSRSGTKSRARR